MAVKLEAVAFVVADAARSASFWSDLLGTGIHPDPGEALVYGDHLRLGLRFVDGEPAQLAPPRMHLHLTSDSPDQQERTVETVLRLGGQYLDVGQTSAETFVVMADPCGIPFCVIEPGNAFLADTGYLGEVTCDGSPAAGRFWSDALDWPLVWDHGEQTAVQSPAGGTKISWDSWTATAAEPRSGLDGQRFDLTTADLTGETSRLVSLGATRLADLPDGMAFADPDGNPFRVRLA